MRLPIQQCFQTIRCFLVLFSAADCEAEIVGWVALQETNHLARGLFADPKSKAIERPALNHALLVLPFAECAENGLRKINYRKTVDGGLLFPQSLWCTGVMKKNGAPFARVPLSTVQK